MLLVIMLLMLSMSSNMVKTLEDNEIVVKDCKDLNKALNTTTKNYIYLANDISCDKESWELEVNVNRYVTLEKAEDIETEVYLDFIADSDSDGGINIYLENEYMIIKDVNIVFENSKDVILDLPIFNLKKSHLFIIERCAIGFHYCSNSDDLENLNWVSFDQDDYIIKEEQTCDLKNGVFLVENFQINNIDTNSQIRVVQSSYHCGAWLPEDLALDGFPLFCNLESSSGSNTNNNDENSNEKEEEEEHYNEHDNEHDNGEHSDEHSHEDGDDRDHGGHGDHGHSHVGLYIIFPLLSLMFVLLFLIIVNRKCYKRSNDGLQISSKRPLFPEKDEKNNLENIIRNVGPTVLTKSTTRAWREVKLEEIRMGEVIGKGAFSTVYKGFFRDMDVAVKLIVHDASLMSNGTEPLEATLSKRFDHPNIVKTFLNETRAEGVMTEGLFTTTMRGANDNETNRSLSISNVSEREKTDEFDEFDEEFPEDRSYRTWIVMEFCSGGNLSQAVANGVFFEDHKRKKLKMDWIILSAIDICQGMMLLHDHHIIHSDLKAQNVMLQRASDDPRGFICKVSDFGLSRLMMHDTHIQTYTCGSVASMPPEVLKDGFLASEADVYSFSIILWELLAGIPPYNNKKHQEIVVDVVEGKRPPLSWKWPNQINKLIEECWQQDHPKRPNFNAIKSRLEQIINTPNRSSIKLRRIGTKDDIMVSQGSLNAHSSQDEINNKKNITLDIQN